MSRDEERMLANAGCLVDAHANVLGPEPAKPARRGVGRGEHLGRSAEGVDRVPFYARHLTDLYRWRQRVQRESSGGLGQTDLLRGRQMEPSRGRPAM